MEKSTFIISKMDCPSEENLIRMKLEDVSAIQQLKFDIPNRLVTVYHEGEIKLIDERLDELNLGSKLEKTELTDETIEEHSNQRKLLWAVLLINFGFFIIESVTGFFSKSMGLVADGLDMLADAFVYGISLLAVGASVLRKKRVARTAGYFQMVLAILGFVEVLRRFFFAEDLPNFQIMMIVSVLALIGNAASLYLLQSSKNKEEAHMKASMIFTSNDVIINIGVIIAGGLVYWLNSKYPDLIIGSIVFILVVQGAVRILKLGK